MMVTVSSGSATRRARRSMSTCAPSPTPRPTWSSSPSPSWTGTATPTSGRSGTRRRRSSWRRQGWASVFLDKISRYPCYICCTGDSHRDEEGFSRRWQDPEELERLARPRGPAHLQVRGRRPGRGDQGRGLLRDVLQDQWRGHRGLPRGHQRGGERPGEETEMVPVFVIQIDEIFSEIHTQDIYLQFQLN